MPTARRPPETNQLINQLAGRPARRSGGQAQSDILAELRQVLRDGGVPPGTAIPVDQVARTFGVSRIPVRESLSTLIGEGLVDHRPHAGYLVAKLTAEDFMGLYTVRGVLEKTALAVAVRQADSGDDTSAIAALEALDTAVQHNDYHAYHVQSRRFHLALVAPSGMRPLLGLLESVWNVTEPFQPMARIEHQQRAELHVEHREMLDHFLARDSAALLRAAGRHLDHLDTSIAGLPMHTGLFSDAGAPGPAGR